MGFHNNITQAVQKAVKAYVLTSALSFLSEWASDEDKHVHTSILDPSAVNPCVLVQCRRAQGRVTTEGNWMARCRVEVRENADDVTEEEHFTNAGELFAAFRTGTLADDLSNALADFTAFLVVVIEQGWDTDGRLWVSYLDMEIECCGSDIA